MARISIQRSYSLFMGGLILTLGLLAGCGGSGLATVEGTVTVDGQLVTAGRVAFRSSDGKNSAVAKISPSGLYRIMDVPCDTMKVTVTPLDKFERVKLQREASGAKAKAKGASGSEGQAKSAGAEVNESSAKVPEKYQHAETSELTFTVKGGSNTYNIEMSSK